MNKGSDNTPWLIMKYIRCKALLWQSVTLIPAGLPSELWNRAFFTCKISVKWYQYGIIWGFSLHSLQNIKIYDNSDKDLDQINQVTTFCDQFMVKFGPLFVLKNVGDRDHIIIYCQKLTMLVLCLHIFSDRQMSGQYYFDNAICIRVWSSQRDWQEVHNTDGNHEFFTNWD